ncbi:MAG: hypothetical protein IBJ12_13790 [Sphingomonadaceae bacterium]|nr:hypothetical protein [Sphingomonadaceae bacterium]
MKRMSNRVILLLLGALALNAAIEPAVAGRRGEQDEARQDMAAGKVKSLREIEATVVPRMRGMQYLGPEYDPTAQVYRLKFIDRDRVIFVDVDGRTGGVLRQR